MLPEPGASEASFDRLYRLIKRDKVLELRKALDAGVSPDLTNRFGWTLLMSAAMKGKTRIAELLLSRGAALNTINAVGWTAAGLAAFGGHIRLLKKLLAAGATAECTPHGHSLPDFLRGGSGLDADAIERILAILAGKPSDRQGP